MMKLILSAPDRVLQKGDRAFQKHMATACFVYRTSLGDFNWISERDQCGLSRRLLEVIPVGWPFTWTYYALSLLVVPVRMRACPFRGVPTYPASALRRPRWFLSRPTGYNRDVEVNREQAAGCVRC